MFVSPFLSCCLASTTFSSLPTVLVIFRHNSMVKSGCALEMLLTFAVVVKSSETHSTSPIVGFGLFNVCVVSNADIISTSGSGSDSGDKVVFEAIKIVLSFFSVDFLCIWFFDSFSRKSSSFSLSLRRSFSCNPTISVDKEVKLITAFVSSSRHDWQFAFTFPCSLHLGAHFLHVRLSTKCKSHKS